MTPKPGPRRFPPPLRRLGPSLGLGLALAAAAPSPAPAIAPSPDVLRPPPAVQALVVEPTVPADREGWLVDSGRGPLRWRPVGGRDWRVAWPGRIVPHASEVETIGAAAWASLVAGGTRMTLHGDGRAVLLRPRDGLEGGAPLRVQQDRGRARYWVGPSTARPRFEVVTPMLVTTVKGTTFDVLVNDDGTVEVLVEEGLVGVTPRARPGMTTPPPGDVAAGEGYRLVATAAAPELFRLSDRGIGGRVVTFPLWLTVAAGGLAALLGLAWFVLLSRDGAVLAGTLWQRWQDRLGGKSRRRQKLLRAGGG